MAAALAVDGVVSHRSAAELWGLIQPAGYVEVSVPSAINRDRAPAGDRPPDQGPAARPRGRAGRPPRSRIQCAPSSTSGSSMPWWLVHRAIAKGISTKALTIGEVRSLRERSDGRGATGPGIVRAILDGQLVFLGKEESELEKRFTALAQAVRPPDAHAAARGLGERSLRRAGRRGDPGAQARDRGRRVRAPLHTRGVPARPDAAERALSRSAGRSSGSPGTTSSTTLLTSPDDPTGHRTPRGGVIPDVCAAIGPRYRY